jgi:hypothetical protein
MPSPVELDGEQDVRRLGLAVGDHAVVVGGEVRIIPADVGEVMAAGGHVDHARAGRGA